MNTQNTSLIQAIEEQTEVLRSTHAAEYRKGRREAIADIVKLLLNEADRLKGCPLLKPDKFLEEVCLNIMKDK